MRSRIKTEASRLIDDIGGAVGILEALSKKGIYIDNSNITKWRKRGIPAIYHGIIYELSKNRRTMAGNVNKVINMKDKDIEELYKALGGSHVVAQELGSSINAVERWLRTGIPAYKINSLKRLCKERDVEFPRKIELKVY